MAEEHDRSQFGFFPPLVIQRRSFCIGILKRDRIESVLELGCGEGSLLKVLSQPACYLDDEFPPDRLSISTSQIIFEDEDHLNSNQIDQRMKKIDEEILSRIPKKSFYDRELHLSLIIGVDVDSERLRFAKQILTGNLPGSSTDQICTSQRLEPQTVELWEGDLGIKNRNFLGIECIVMTEVIEHLTSVQLDRSIPLIFSYYRPSTVIITTPNHEFNQYLDQYQKKCSNSERRHRFPDPTHRTNRYFRDDDHKFEWTQDEFQEWCQAISLKYDYHYEISGCGSFTNCFGSIEKQLHGIDDPIPAPKCPKMFFATQAVVFKRGELKTGSLGLSELNVTDTVEQSHQLIFKCDFPVDPMLAQPINHHQILRLVEDYYVSLGFPAEKLRLREPWMCQKGLDLACHGRLTELIRSFAFEEGWELILDPSFERLGGMDSIWIKCLKKLPLNLLTNDMSEPEGDLSDVSSIKDLPELENFEKDQSGWD
ncbi:S-adenosylmethionine-dependentmethyltransferase [Phakopsora pachyrhizi]|nr:S-adenosylmethionine-dependentmethyltransferase [Phakopsora pachyrhizi]